MVRGNWQKRVEKAQARRDEAKHIKIKKDSRGIYKGLVQNHLWPLLNHYSDDILRQGVTDTGNTHILHLWVDSRPSSLNLDEDDDERSRNRDRRGNVDRKNSFDSCSGSVNTSSHRQRLKCEKNKHPRSHAPSSTGSINCAEADANILLCKQHFFNGRCDFMSEGKGSKRVTCPYNHFSKQNGQQTLVDVLCPSRTDRKNVGNDEPKAAEKLVAQAILSSSSAAAAAAFAKGGDSDEKSDIDHSPVHMVYHVPISLFSSTEKNDSVESNDTKDKAKVTDFIQKTLASEKCPIGSIVYIVFNKILIFDRYNGGVLVDKEREFEIFLSGGTSKIDMRNDAKSGDGGTCISRIDSLPGSVLEFILKFLPDEASGVLPMVCKVFSQEIGMLSPSLWKYLIARRGWPMPEDEYPLQPLRDTYKYSFLSHYKVFRNVRCIKNGIERLRDGNSCDVAVIAYTSAKIPVCAQPWNDTSVIAADEFDCTLKLFEAVRNGPRLLCKEIKSARVAPFPNSKKFCCTLVSMNLDDVYIACCFKTGKQGEDSINTWLVAIKRNDYLCNDSGANQECLDGLQKYDMQEYFVTHLIETLYENNLPQDLNEYIFALGGDLASIKLSLFEKIEACGNGLFMLIGNIFVPEELRAPNMEVDSTRVLLLFSIPRELIVWSHFITEDPEFPLDVDNDHIIHSCVQNGSQSTSSSATYLCCASSPIHLTRIERRSGEVTCGTIDERLVVSRYQTLFEDRWASFDLSERYGLVTKSHVVFADVLQLRFSSESKVMLSFVPLRVDAPSGSGPLYDDSAVSSVTLERCHEVQSLHYDGGDHVVVHCMYKGDAYRTCYLLVVHIPSRVVIHRCSVIGSLSIRHDIPHVLTCDGTNGEAMALFMYTGFVMTSSVIRSLIKAPVAVECPKPISKSSKKKKKKRLVSKGKKDGFARGMSARG